jgi:pyroglutamyl-peptidase
VILVTGFGPFPGVELNPTAGVVRAIHGRRLAGHTVVGRVLPVAWRRGPAETIAVARRSGAALVVGLGVATRRDRVEVERQAVRMVDRLPDADGSDSLGLEGPECVAATLDVDQLARALAAGTSSDAGRYVCNAWLYQVTLGLDVPVGFVHVPRAGIAVDRLLRGLTAIAPPVGFAVD